MSVHELVCPACGKRMAVDCGAEANYHLLFKQRDEIFHRAEDLQAKLEAAEKLKLAHAQHEEGLCARIKELEAKLAAAEADHIKRWNEIHMKASVRIAELEATILRLRADGVDAQNEIEHLKDERRRAAEDG